MRFAVCIAAALSLGPGLAGASVPGDPDTGRGPPAAAAEAPTARATTLPAGAWELALQVGHVLPASPDEEGTGDFVWPGVAVGLADRWQLTIFPAYLAERFPPAGGLAVARRFGEPGGTEVVASSALGGGNDRERGGILIPALSLALRQALGNGRSLFAEATGQPRFEWGAAGSRAPLEAWRVAGTLGIGWELGDRFTLTPGLGVAGSRNFLEAAPGREDAVVLGSVAGVAGRKRPLIQLHLTPDLSLDGHASATWSTRTERWSQVFALGATWTP